MMTSSPKHLFHIAAFAFIFNTVNAQQNESCDGIHSEEAIIKFYQRNIARKIDQADLFSLAFAGKDIEIKSFKTWAKSEGYFAKIDTAEDKSKNDSGWVEILVKLKKPTLEHFSIDYKKIIAQKNELGIQDCGRSSVTYNYANQLPGRCGGMYLESIYKRYYDRILANHISGDELINFHFAVLSSDSKMLKEWAEINGFKNYYDPEQENMPKDSLTLVSVRFTKQFKKPYYPFFSKTLKKVGELKADTGLDYCGDYYVLYKP